MGKVETRLWTHADVERAVSAPEAVSRMLDGGLALCTIVEVLLVAERARKGRGRINLGEFLAGWRALQQGRGPDERGYVYIAPLDRECLVEAFEDDHGRPGDAQWSAAAGIESPPETTIRWLVLRPSPRKWWGAEECAEVVSW